MGLQEALRNGSISWISGCLILKLSYMMVHIMMLILMKISFKKLAASMAFKQGALKAKFQYLL